ncbi:MAG TPA: hypothetical protein VGB77_07540 [Abditibacteriaceae bacterium]|jgi:hypothetical protein
MTLDNREALNEDSEQAPLRSTPQNQVMTNQAPDVPPSDDPVGTRILYVVVAMIVLMFLISVGFLLLVVRRRL